VIDEGLLGKAPFPAQKTFAVREMPVGNPAAWQSPLADKE